MVFTKKKISAQELGNTIYANIRYSVMSSDAPLSHESFMKELKENPDELPLSYIIELLIGLLFGTLHSIEKKYQYPKAGEIMDGVRTEFIKHAKLLSNDATDDQFNSLIVKRFQEYSECLSNQSGAGPVWHLGKQYYWNIIDQKKEDVTPVMYAGLYIFKATELTDLILKDYKVL